MPATETIGRFEVRPDTNTAASRLRWRLNRLRCMTSAEIGHRVMRMVTIQAERLLGSARAPAPRVSPTDDLWLRGAPQIDPAPYLAAAERICAGRLDIFAMKDVDLGSPPRWNRDPKTGIEAPLAFGKLLDYRNPDTVGDIKYLWEPNRHLHFVTLAQAYALTRNPKYFDTIAAHLESWIEACPYRKGPNWSSALEAGIRLINWSLAWRLLGGAASPLFANARGARVRDQWLLSVFQHAQYVRGFFSLYSSANNHLVGEAVGVWIAGLTWPFWPQARAWRKEAKSILEREVLLQNGADGVNREQAVSYQQFEIDLLLLALLAGRAGGLEFSVCYQARLEAMLEYVASIMDSGGNLPMFGDADDGAVVRLAQGARFCPYRSLLATGAIVFGRGDFKAKAGALDDKTRWLIGAGVDERFDAQPVVSRPVRQAFRDGGCYILGCEFETAREIRLVADAGPLGYQSIAAHGHADALSFTLSVAGLEFFIDPGTYAYHTQAAWRQYFRGTSAHNTLRVDEMDQSEPGGNFMWLHKARAGCNGWSSSPESDDFTGWHDGYQRLPDPVLHRRRIVLDKRTRIVTLEDRLEMSGEHEIELFFHCSERCTVSPTEDGYAIEQGGTTLWLRLPRALGATSRVLVGSHAPISGWVSRRFDAKTPAPTIVWRARVPGNAGLRTEICC